MVFICEKCGKKQTNIFFSWRTGKYFCWGHVPKMDKHKHKGLVQALSTYKQELKMKAKHRHEDELSTPQKRRR